MLQCLTLDEMPGCLLSDEMPVNTFFLKWLLKSLRFRCFPHHPGVISSKDVKGSAEIQNPLKGAIMLLKLLGHAALSEITNSVFIHHKKTPNLP